MAVGGYTAATAAAGGMPDPTSYAAIGWLLVSVVAIITGANQVIKLWDRISGQGKSAIPQPLQVEQAVKFVTKEQCEHLHQTQAATVQALKVELNELRQQRIQDAKDSSFSRKALYAEIKEANENATAHIEAVRKELSERIEAMPDRVVALLRNTGVIR